MKKLLVTVTLLFTLLSVAIYATPSIFKQSAIHNITEHLGNITDKNTLENAKKHWFKGKKSHLFPKKNAFNKYKKRHKKHKRNIFKQLHVGFGGTSAYDFYAAENNEIIWMSNLDLLLDDNIAENTYYQKIKDFEAEDFSTLQSKLKNSKYIIYWLPKNWSEYWFDTEQIQLAMDKGYIPVFMYWYFGDTLVSALPTEEELVAYKKNNQKLSDFLSKLNGKKMIIMEPEFNKSLITSNEENANTLAQIIADAIDTIKVNNQSLLVSLCMTDTGNRNENTVLSSCGYDNCALGDKSSWDTTEQIYTKLLQKLDFISFQEMLAQFSRDPHNPGTWNHPNPKAYTKSNLGVNLLAQRIVNFSEYLHKKYNKPIFLPYMTIATAVWKDSNDNNAIEQDELDLDGWNDVASNVYQNLSDLKDKLQSKGLFGYAPIALFDHPGHDKGGYQYFMNNEYHLGITKTTAQDTTDIHLLGDILPKSTIIDFIY